MNGAILSEVGLCLAAVALCRQSASVRLICLKNSPKSCPVLWQLAHFKPES